MDNVDVFKNIFYSRQGCAIESAGKANIMAIQSIQMIKTIIKCLLSALANPTWDVFLLFASPVGFSNDTVKSPTITALESYPNVHLRNVNLWTYAQDTPMSSFINNGQLFRSKYVNSHTSDFLRYLR